MNFMIISLYGYWITYYDMDNYYKYPMIYIYIYITYYYYDNYIMIEIYDYNSLNSDCHRWYIIGD